MRRDYSAFFDDGVIEFDAPSKAHPEGRTYRVEMEAERGLWLSGLVETATLTAAGITVTEEKLAELKLGNDDEQILFSRRVLGPTYDEMFTDGVSWPLIRRITTDIFICFTQDEAEADRIIEQSLADRGKAEASVNRASRRAAAKKPSPTTSSRATTARPTAGSRSSRASGATKGRGKAAASTPSSTSTPSEDAAAQAV